MKSNGKASGEVTIFDVASEASVSYATVSRVINNKGSVSKEARERVLGAMTRLGYVVNQQARSLAGGRSQVVGLLVQDLGTSYHGEIIRGIDNEIANAHYELMLYTTHRRKTKESAYVSQLTHGLADGLLLILPRNPQAYLDTLRQSHFPYVLIDHQGIDQHGPAVGATNWQGAYDATHYLIELGHMRIGFITGRMDIGCSVERLEGYKAALTHHGIAIDPEMIREGDFLQPQGYSAAQALLALRQKPTAIFASNDVSAFGAMEAIRVRGLRIPDDISVVGFDDIPQASQVHPALTTVRQPLEQMGRVAAQLLLRAITKGETPTERVTLPTELIIRQSSQSPAV